MGVVKDVTCFSSNSAFPGVQLSHSTEDALGEAAGKDRRQRRSPKRHKRSHSDSSTATSRIDLSVVNKRYISACTCTFLQSLVIKICADGVQVDVGLGVY